VKRVWRCKVCGQPESFLLHPSDHEPEMELVGRTPDQAQEALRLIHGFMLDCNAIGLHGAAENLHKGIKASAPDEGRVCERCQGSGDVHAMTQGHGPDDYELAVQCPECDGTGRTCIQRDDGRYVGNMPCPTCQPRGAK
jgi:hypothetical protein